MDQRRLGFCQCRDRGVRSFRLVCRHPWCFQRRRGGRARQRVARRSFCRERGARLPGPCRGGDRRVGGAFHRGSRLHPVVLDNLDRPGRVSFQSVAPPPQKVRFATGLGQRDDLGDVAVHALCVAFRSLSQGHRPHQDRVGHPARSTPVDSRGLDSPVCHAGRSRQPGNEGSPPAPCSPGGGPGHARFARCLPDRDAHPAALPTR